MMQAQLMMQAQPSTSTTLWSIQVVGLTTLKAVTCVDFELETCAIKKAGNCGHKSNNY